MERRREDIGSSAPADTASEHCTMCLREDQARQHVLRRVVGCGYIDTTVGCLDDKSLGPPGSYDVQAGVYCLVASILNERSALLLNQRLHLSFTTNFVAFMCSI